MNNNRGRTELWSQQLHIETDWSGEDERGLRGQGGKYSARTGGRSWREEEGGGGRITHISANICCCGHEVQQAASRRWNAFKGPSQQYRCGVGGGGGLMGVLIT